MNRFEHPVEFQREFDALQKIKEDPNFKGDSAEAIHNRVRVGLEFLAKWDEPDVRDSPAETFDA